MSPNVRWHWCFLSTLLSASTLVIYLCSLTSGRGKSTPSNKKSIQTLVPTMLQTGIENVPKPPVAEFDRIPKSAYTLAAQLVFRQLFLKQKVFLHVKIVFSDKICQQIWKPPNSIAIMLPHFLCSGLQIILTKQTIWINKCPVQHTFSFQISHWLI